MIKNFTKFATLQNSEIHAKLQDNKLQLKIAPNQGIKTWEAQVTDLGQCSEMLPKLFGDLSDLLDHLQDPNNVRIDFQAEILEILLKTTLKNKQTYTQIGKIKMVPIKGIDLQNIIFSDISKVCQSQINISNTLLKKILGLITQKVEGLTVESKLDEALDPIINKFKIVGSQTENLQNKLGGLYEEIDKIKQLNQKSILDALQEIEKLKKQTQQNHKKLQSSMVKEIVSGQAKFLELCNQLQDRIQKVNINKKIEWLEVEKLKGQLQNIQLTLYKLMDLSQKHSPQKLEQIMKPLNSAAFFVDTSLPFFSHFKIDKMQISKTKTTPGYFTMLVGKNSMGDRKKFTVKIKNIQAFPVMMFGIIESAHKKQQFCEKADNRIWLSTQGIIFDGQNQKNTGKPFTAKESITIQVDASTGKIAWKNAANTFSINSNRLKNPFAVWYPCVWMAEIGDTIEWIN